LLEGILAFEYGVSDSMCEDQPTGIRRKFPALLEEALRKLAFPFMAL